MDIILLERIESLGKIGDVVKVKDGFARNFLLPMKKALRATEANKKYFETQRKAIEEKNLEAKAEAERLAKKIAGVKIVLLRQAGEGGQLYGSVSARDIAAGLQKLGHKVNRDQVELTSPIKDTGMFEVTVRLHGEVSFQLAINVARTDDEAISQEETARKALELFESEEAAKAAAKTLLGEDAGEEKAPAAAEGEAPTPRHETRDAKPSKKEAAASEPEPAKKEAKAEAKAAEGKREKKDAHKPKKDKGK